MTGIFQVTCGHCMTVNRVDRQRPAAQGRCGRCKGMLFEGRPLDLTQETFQRHIQQTQIPVVVDFWAGWCGPCKAMAPAFQQAAQVLEPRARLAKVDTEAVPLLASQFGIQAIPTLILFKGGRETARQSGAMTLSQLTEWIQPHL